MAQLPRRLCLSSSLVEIPRGDAVVLDALAEAPFDGELGIVGVLLGALAEPPSSALSVRDALDAFAEAADPTLLGPARATPNALVEAVLDLLGCGKMLAFMSHGPSPFREVVLLRG